MALRLGVRAWSRHAKRAAATSAPPSELDVSLRPPVFAEFIGQEKIKERLMLMVEAARQRRDVLDHVLPEGWRRRAGRR